MVENADINTSRNVEEGEPTFDRATTPFPPCNLSKHKLQHVHTCSCHKGTRTQCNDKTHNQTPSVGPRELRLNVQTNTYVPIHYRITSTEIISKCNLNVLHNDLTNDQLPCMVFIKLGTQTQPIGSVPKYQCHKAD